MSRFILGFIVVIFWGGVFSGSFSGKTWTNSNPDTFIHGTLSLTGTLAVIYDFTRKKKAVQ